MGQHKARLGVTHRQGLFFIIIGSLNAFIHFLALIFFIQIIKIDPFFANFFAFLIAFVFGFLGHLNITFRRVEYKKDWRVSCVKWLLSSIFGFVLNQVLFTLGIYCWGIKYYVLIWIVVTGCVTVFTFLLAKFWAFQVKKKI